VVSSDEVVVAMPTPVGFSDEVANVNFFIIFLFVPISELSVSSVDRPVPKNDGRGQGRCFLRPVLTNRLRIHGQMPIILLFLIGVQVLSRIKLNLRTP
jgi:hypothetical protein